MIRPDLSDMIIDYKTQGQRKIQLTMSILFLPKVLMKLVICAQKNNNTKIMMGNETDEIINELFEPFSQNYQKDLEESVRGSVDLLYYHLQKLSLKRGRSYIDSPESLKNKKATINPKNNDDKCFQYALTAALN